MFHFISNFSSSFIEEEHQFWYFVSTTFVLIQAIYKAAAISVYNITNVVCDCSVYVAILLVDRVLRILNQTGDKWAHLPDVGDWLNKYGCKSLLD